MIVVLKIFRMLIVFKIIVEYSCVVFNVKVIYIEKKIIILFITHASPTNKFMALPLLTPLNKNPRAVTVKDSPNVFLPLLGFH